MLSFSRATAAVIATFVIAAIGGCRGRLPRPVAAEARSPIPSSAHQTLQDVSSESSMMAIAGHPIRVRGGESGFCQGRAERI